MRKALKCYTFAVSVSFLRCLAEVIMCIKTVIPEIITHDPETASGSYKQGSQTIYSGIVCHTNRDMMVLLMSMPCSVSLMPLPSDSSSPCFSYFSISASASLNTFRNSLRQLSPVSSRLLQQLSASMIALLRQLSSAITSSL